MTNFWLHFATASIIVLSTVSSLTNRTSKSCVLNPFYMPVCGSDGQTYGNRELLRCHNLLRHRVDKRVRIVARTECKPLVCPSYTDLIGPWHANYPVCANNGNTYGHILQVRCLKDFHPDLEVLHEGGCTVSEVRRMMKRQNVTRVVPTACNNPRRHFEQNPVCSGRNETFANPFQAICEMRGRVYEKMGGACGSPTQKACEQSHAFYKGLRAMSHNERTMYTVCGSDWRTYRTRQNLECFRRFNKYLVIRNYEKCKGPSKPCPERLRYVKRPTPVCGSDQQSYVNYEALICAQHRMKKNLKFLHNGACVQRT